MKTPNEIIEATHLITSNKKNLPLGKLILLSILAGIYIAMGGAFAVTMGFGVPEISAQNPAIVKILMGLTFPIGLALITLLGAELFTGNCAVLVPSLIRKEIGVGDLLKNWTIVWLGNFAGALFFGYCLIYLTGVLNISPWREALAVKIGRASCRERV